jgi:transposase
VTHSSQALQLRPQVAPPPPRNRRRSFGTLRHLTDTGPRWARRRARIVLAWLDGKRVEAIARELGVHEDTVRRAISSFQKRGLAALQHGNRGKPKNVVFDARVQREIFRLAGMAPKALGEPFATWSLYKLRDRLIRRGVVISISRERLRQLLRDGVYSRRHWPRK